MCWDKTSSGLNRSPHQNVIRAIRPVGAIRVTGFHGSTGSRRSSSMNIWNADSLERTSVATKHHSSRGAAEPAKELDIVALLSSYATPRLRAKIRCHVLAENVEGD